MSEIDKRAAAFLKLWPFALIAGLFLIAGYAMGRFFAPEKVKTVEKTVTHTIEDTKAKETIRSLLAQIETMKKQTHRETTVVTRKDGTKEIKIVTDTRVDQHTEAHAETEKVRVETRTVEVVKEVVKEKLIERSRPDWMVGPMIGLNGLDYGAHVDRRILGPIFLGAWGFSSGRIGASLSAQF